MQKYRRSISYARISCPGFVFRAKTGFASAGSVAADKSANSIRGPRRPRGGTYLKIPAARTFQFVIGNICARACALCNFGTPPPRRRTSRRGCSITGATLIIPRFHSGASSPAPLKPASPRKLHDSPPSPPSIFFGEIIPCSSCTLISRH